MPSRGVILPVSMRAMETEGLSWPPEMWRVAVTMTAMARPWARAMARRLMGRWVAVWRGGFMLAMAPMPMKMRVKVPMNSATQGGRSFMRGNLTDELEGMEIFEAHMANLVCHG